MRSSPAMFQLAPALHTLILGQDPRQYMRLSQTLLVLVVYVLFAAVQHVEVMLGLVQTSESWALTAWNLCGGIGFYLAASNLKWCAGRPARSRRVQVPDDKEVAKHVVPESCVMHREVQREALTGVRTGQPLSRHQGATASPHARYRCRARSMVDSSGGGLLRL